MKEWSGRAGGRRMKCGKEVGLGRQSLPGRPVIFRRVRGEGPLGIIAQAGEAVPENYVLLSGNDEAMDQLRLCNVADLERAMQLPEEQRVAVHSPETAALVKVFSRNLGRS